MVSSAELWLGWIVGCDVWVVIYGGCGLVIWFFLGVSIYEVVGGSGGGFGLAGGGGGCGFVGSSIEERETKRKKEEETMRKTKERIFK